MLWFQHAVFSSLDLIYLSLFSFLGAFFLYVLFMWVDFVLCICTLLLLLLLHKYEYNVWVCWLNVPEMPSCFADCFQLCHMPSGQTPKQTLYPLVFALDDDLHFPQQKRFWDPASAAVSDLKSTPIPEIRWECCNKGHVFLFTLTWSFPTCCSWSEHHHLHVPGNTCVISLLGPKSDHKRYTRNITLQLQLQL